jgi:hypothetical protein
VHVFSFISQDAISERKKETKKGGTVLGVGCREPDVGSVVSGAGKLRSEREWRDCVRGMIIWRSDGAVERTAMELGFQTVN